MKKKLLLQLVMCISISCFYLSGCGAAKEDTSVVADITTDMNNEVEETTAAWENIDIQTNETEEIIDKEKTKDELSEASDINKLTDVQTENTKKVNWSDTPLRALYPEPTLMLDWNQPRAEEENYGNVVLDETMTIEDCKEYIEVLKQAGFIEDNPFPVASNYQNETTFMCRYLSPEGNAIGIQANLGEDGKITFGELYYENAEFIKKEY